MTSVTIGYVTNTDTTNDTPFILSISLGYTTAFNKENAVTLMSMFPDHVLVSAVRGRCCWLGIHEITNAQWFIEAIK